MYRSLTLISGFGLLIHGVDAPILLNRARRQFVAADVFRMVSMTLDLVERYMVLLGLRQQNEPEILILNRLTGGAFAITIAPLTAQWDFTGGTNRMPTDEERIAALPLVDDEQLTLGENNTVTLPAGMQIDLGGIAKGYIADRVAALVRGRCSGAMLNFGGNVYAVGTKPDGSAYRVGVQDPDEPNSSTPTGLMSVTNSSSPIGVVSVIDRSVVTSGIYERGFTIDGVRYHHILSPWTGLPSDSDLASATIIAESSMDADALATACIVLGSEKALQLTQENGYPALMILRDGTVMMNDLMKQWGYTSLR